MSLLNALIAENIQILVGIDFIFLKKTSYIKLESLSIPHSDVKNLVK